MLTPVFANAAGEVLAHSAGYAVLRYRPGSPALAPLAALMTSMAELLLARGWQLLLSDARPLSLLSDAAKQWVQANWVEGGMRRPPFVQVAMLLPTDVLARLAVAQTQVNGRRFTPHTYFTDEAAAHAFLAAQARA